MQIIFVNVNVKLYLLTLTKLTLCKVLAATDLREVVV